MSNQNDDNDDDGGLEKELNKYYLYQNKHTGEVSSNPLTVRQLCLVLSNRSSAAMITGDTMVIGIDGETKSYSRSGWKAARSIPVLREACSSWHYEDGSGVVKGPVSLRVVQDGLVQNGRVWSPDIAAAAKQNESNQNNENESGENKSQNSKKCNDLESRWRTVSEDLNLVVAMKALGRRQQDQEKDQEKDLGGVDPATMIMYEDEDEDEDENSIEDELGAFLNEHDTSDHALLTSEQHISSLTSNKRRDIANPLKKKTKKPKFNARNASKWIYVTNVPKDATEHELVSHFSRAGIIDLDPLTQQPRVKLYRHPTTNITTDGLQGTLKGDASICYARIESVDLAIQILDESLLRATSKTPLRVSKAKFQQKNSNNQTAQTSNHASNNLTLKQRRIAKIAVHQRLNWDEGENGRLSGGRKGLSIVVFKHVFPPFRNDKTSQNSHLEEDVYFQTMERQIRNQCETHCGPVQKITIFSKNTQGVVIVKFTKTSSATAAIETFHAKDTTFLLPEQTRSTNNNTNRSKLEVTFWDYVTDYDHQDYHEQQQEEEDRLDRFGSWLDNQELPEEFKLKVEGD